ncbi:hypothetical protein [Rhodococcoides fascians]|nr:hypothetical protein [Rhodococcus fascians]
MSDYIKVDHGYITDVPKTTQTLDFWSALMLLLIGVIVTMPWWAVS